MNIAVKLYATLRQYAPEDTEIGGVFHVELEEATLGDLLAELGIAEEKAKIIMLNGVRVSSLNRNLEEGDMVVIFPPVGGGKQHESREYQGEESW